MHEVKNSKCIYYYLVQSKDFEIGRSYSTSWDEEKFVQNRAWKSLT